MLLSVCKQQNKTINLILKSIEKIENKKKPKNSYMKKKNGLSLNL